MEKLGRFLGAFLSIMLFMGIYSMAEDITLTTYYPAPYGAYEELSAETLEVYQATAASEIASFSTDATTRVKIKSGASTQAQLKFENGTTDTWTIFSDGNTDNFQISKTVGTGDVVIWGNSVGINNASPSFELDVNGTINATAYSAGGTVGVPTNTFTTLEGKTVTVKNGIIVSITGP